VATALDVAKWLMDKLDREGVVYAAQAPGEVEEVFGADFTGPTDSGGWGLNADVRRAFKDLWQDVADWLPGEKCWHMKKSRPEYGT
jgi:hypothetical protein